MGGMLIRYSPGQDERPYNIQIDMGKTYRESALRWYPRFDVPFVDAVVISHEHADACMGLDELRPVHQLPATAVPGTLANAMAEIAPVPVFVGARHMSRVVSIFVAKIKWHP